FIARGDEMHSLNYRLERVYALYPNVNAWTIIVGDVDDTSITGNVRIYMMDEYVHKRSKSRSSTIIPLSSIIEDIREFMNSRGIRPFNIVA
ncbi:MAG: hypothetical protein QXM95_00715, partial [Candidatus Nitrosocaldus sp.]